MVYVQYGDGQRFVVTPDHLFLMPDGKLKRAERLVPGRDQFVLAKGGTTPIVSLAIGAYQGGVHNIAATDTSVDGRLEGHLLDANGIVSGDYALQLGTSRLGLRGVAKGCGSLWLIRVLGFVRRWMNRLRYLRER